MLKDSEILDALKSKDPNRRNLALGSLYKNEKVRIKIRQFLEHYNADKVDFDDVLQEGIIRLDENVRHNKFNEQSKISTYLISICRFVILNFLKKKEDATFDPTTYMSDEEKLNAPLAESLIEANEFRDEKKHRDDILIVLIKQMRAKCRDGITLFHINKLSMAEIAQEIGVKNANQAKKTISECRKQLRKMILEHPLYNDLFSASISLTAKNKFK